MSEAEKKARATSGQPESGDRGATIKPFPDFIAASASPGAVPPGTLPGGGATANPAGPSVAAPTASAAPSSSGGPSMGASSMGGSSMGGVAPGGGSGQSLPPTPAPRAKTPPPPRARGGGWAFLFALVSVAAAGVSLSGPSIRPIAAEKLRQQFGDQEWIGIVTGTADTRPPSVIQLDLAAFDRRLDALAQTLTTANPGAPVDGETLARFADAAGAKSEIAAMDASLRSAQADGAERDAALSSAIGGMETQLAELTQRADDLGGGVGSLTDALGRVEANTGKALELAEGADTASKELATALGGLMPRLDQAEAGLAALTTQLQGVTSGVGERVTAALGPIGQRLDGLEGRVTELTTSLDGALAPIRTQLAALDEGTRASITEATAALAALKEELTTTRSGIEALDGKLTALEAAGTARQGAVVSLEEKLAANTSAATALAGRVGEVEAALKRQAGVNGSALLGLTNRVRIAVDEGEGYAAELAVIRTLAGGDPRYDAPLTVLATMAERGAPSLGYLRREFNVVARKVIEVEEAAQPTWYDRQWSNMRYYLGWTSTQPGVEPPAPDPEPARAVLAEAANAINGGHFDQAVVAMAGLRGPGAEQAAQWIGAARARVAADQAIRGLSTLALGQIHR